MRSAARVRAWLAVAGLLAALAPAPVTAQDRSEQAIKHRRAAFTLMSSYFGRLLQTVEGHRPFDPRQVAADAQTVLLLSRLPWEGFAPGSERGDTRAKEDIWLEEDRFQQLASDLQARAADLDQAARSGDLERLKLAFASTRSVCNSCHKAFRTQP
jgi:cytochrome c556